MLESQKSRIAWIELLNGAMTEANKMPLSPDIFKVSGEVEEYTYKNQLSVLGTQIKH